MDMFFWGVGWGWEAIKNGWDFSVDFSLISKPERGGCLLFSSDSRTFNMLKVEQDRSVGWLRMGVCSTESWCLEKDGKGICWNYPLSSNSHLFPLIIPIVVRESLQTFICDCHPGWGVRPIRDMYFMSRKTKWSCEFNQTMFLVSIFVVRQPWAATELAHFARQFG